MPTSIGPKTDELLEQLAEAEHRTWQIERELRKTQSSTSFLLGRTLVFAAKRPSILLRLPVELWRLFGGRGRRTDMADPVTAGPERLLTFYRSLVRERDGPLVAVVASRRIVQALAGTFDVVPLWPHDARQVANAVTPDLVLLESAASMPGEAWSALGTAAQAGLGELLSDMIRGFQRRSVPVVFWWTTPVDVTVDLGVLVDRCDWIASDTSVPGVPDMPSLSLGAELRAVEPRRPAEEAADARPMLHLGGYEPDPRTHPTNRLVDAAIKAGARILREPSHLYAGDRMVGRDELRLRYRGAGWTTPTTTDLSHRCLAMLASGVPVLMQEPPTAICRIVDEVPPGIDPVEVADAARQRIGTPEGMAEILRTVHVDGTTRRRFRGVLEHLGIDDERTDDDAIGVSVDAQLDTSSAIAAIVGQSIRPAEVLVRNQNARRRLAVELQTTGIPVRLFDDAEATLHAVWSGGPWYQTYLHDLLVASQVVGTDRFSDRAGVVMTGSMGAGTALPWWIREAPIG